MNERIKNTFAALKEQKRAAFIPFIMGGDPNYDTSLELLKTLPEAGADIIELGIPFSDPMADGPAIQSAGWRALAEGHSLRKSLDMVAEFRKTNTETPLILMGYFNPIYHYGVEDFAKDAAEAGVDGLICVDVPYEEASELTPHLRAQKIDTIPLIAPPSLTPQRLAQLTKDASGYLYYVSIAGITGAAAATKESVSEAMAKIREATDLPVCVGFGIKTKDDVANLKDTADGIIVGSALIKTVESCLDAPHNQLISKVIEQVRELASGVQ